MPFLLLLLLAIACLPESWPQPLAWVGIPEGNPVLFSCLTWLGVLALVVLAARISSNACRQLELNPGRREAILQRHAALRRYHLYALYVFFEVAVFLCGWGWTVQFCLTAGADGALWPGAELVIVAPFFVALIFSWALFYATERAVHRSLSSADALDSFWTRGAYVRFHLRQNLALIAAPLLLLIVTKSLRRIVPETEYDWMISLFLIVSVFVTLPWILRLALGLTPLPQGPLRARLEAAARRLNFRCSNILLWNTHGGVANAMVAGILPFLRYVLLSDRLVSELTPDEVEAVFGHEIGHVKHRHMFYYLGFLFISLTVVAGLWNLAASRWEGLAVIRNKDLEVLPLVTIAGAYIFVVFGFLSRRCERQADIFGCRAVSCARPDCAGHDNADVLVPDGRGLCPTGIRTFIDALERVARINGISRNKPGWLQSWQHSTIARRVEFLQRVLVDPGVEPRFQRTVGLVKWGLLLFLSAVLGALCSTRGWDTLGLF